jgi:hypothetical protein
MNLGAINLVPKLLTLDAEMLSTERKVKTDMLKIVHMTMQLQHPRGGTPIKSVDH